MSVPADGPDWIVCPKCQVRIRVRRVESPAAPAEEFIRFVCPCGRRLKVRAQGLPQAGQCPACGRIVPVPSLARPTPTPIPPPSHPQIRTDELGAADREGRETRGEGRGARSGPTS